MIIVKNSYVYNINVFQANDSKIFQRKVHKLRSKTPTPSKRIYLTIQNNITSHILTSTICKSLGCLVELNKIKLILKSILLETND